MPARIIASQRGIASPRTIASPRGRAAARGFTGVQSAAVYVEDFFTDSDAVTLPNHTPDIDIEGGGWIAGSGAWDILSNQASQDSGSAGLNSVRIDSGQANVIVECDTKTAGDTAYVGVIFRNDGADDGWEVQLLPSADELYLIKNNTGSRTVEVTASVTIEPNTTYAIKITLDGSSIKVELDGTEHVDTTDAYNSTDTEHGLMQWNAVTGTRWDNFKVSAL